MRRTQGFTLIELMIVVAIIAILAAIAVPWYGRYTYRARRADGQKLLLHIAQVEERFYTDYNHYPLTASSLGYTSNSPVSENGYYTASLALPSAASAGQGYVATAVPQGPQASDVCGNLSVDNTGQELPSAASTAKNSNGNCW
ncbi:MAG: prepilin-type N-terminal cleavage/methylation domain-containing protein [Proteobacteria bacterium]|nr:prepilin-type N-terminal cleavage/methylation domain-containing protein [Pseudomonadota bacterium]